MNSASAQPAGRRVLAAILSTTLLLGAISPGLALAREAESEGEGTAPPGAVAPGPESGEETALEELPGSELAGGSEETGEGSLESEPVVEPESPPPIEAPASPTTVEPEVPSPSVAPSPEAEAPEYGPDYEPAPETTPGVPVENEPLSAPASAAPQADHSSSPPAPVHEEAPTVPYEAPPRPVESPATAPEPPQTSGSLGGRQRYMVRPGECLWLIAAALLPAGAGNGAIAAEVSRLWRLNAARIGTGDPNLLYAGTELRLR
jgi:hypothetical protein